MRSDGLAKNDPNDALSVALAALRSRTRRQVTAEDYRAVLKVWSKRHRDLSRLRNQVACRLHAVLCDLVPGGHPKEITAAHAARQLLHQTEHATGRRSTRPIVDNVGDLARINFLWAVAWLRTIAVRRN